MSKEEIQHNMDDDQTNRMIFNALKRQPSYELQAGFADRVLHRMAQTEKASSREMFWLYAGLVAFVIAALVAIVMTGFKPNFGALKFISGYSGLLIFGAAFILGLQWLDKKIIHKIAL